MSRKVTASEANKAYKERCEEWNRKLRKAIKEDYAVLLKGMTKRMLALTIKYKKKKE